MPKIKIEQLLEGMVVASDVKNIDSMLLVPAGCTLTPRHINILSAWGISEIEVDAAAGVENVDLNANVSEEELEHIKNEIRTRFWKVDETNPVFIEVFNLLLERRLKSKPAEFVAV